MVKEIEIKIGNSKRLVLEDGILRDKDLKVLERKQGVISDVLMVILVFVIFGKQIGVLIGINSLVNRIVKLIV